jgi:hypothetical protein
MFVFYDTQKTESDSPQGAFECSICRTEFQLQKLRPISQFGAAMTKLEILVSWAMLAILLATIAGATVLALQYERITFQGLVIGFTIFICMALFW